jgi:hypothetical protein
MSSRCSSSGGFPFNAGGSCVLDLLLPCCTHDDATEIQLAVDAMKGGGMRMKIKPARGDFRSFSLSSSSLSQ